MIICLRQVFLVLIEFVERCGDNIVNKEARNSSEGEYSASNLWGVDLI